MQVSIIELTSQAYPALLREITDPPARLYVRGQLPAPTAPLVSIVGTRRPDDYGRRITYQLANELARAGVVIVSGLAYGLDAIAHRAAVEAGGQTIAVLGSGVDTITPVANRSLGESILAHDGAIISEQAPGTPALPQHIVARNRIVAGLSPVVIVTQAAIKSGTLLTANFAHGYNRLIMAVPGNITAPLAAGPNNLIRQDWAKAVTGSVDVLTELAIPEQAVPHPPRRAASARESKLLSLLGAGVTTTQGLIDGSHLSAAEVAEALSLMEITGKLTNLGAGHWATR